MPHQIQIRKTAQKQLDKLPDDIADTLLDAIETLAENPRPKGCKKLKGRSGFRIRKGDYRIRVYLKLHVQPPNRIRFG